MSHKGVLFISWAFSINFLINQFKLFSQKKFAANQFLMPVISFVPSESIKNCWFYIVFSGSINEITRKWLIGMIWFNFFLVFLQVALISLIYLATQSFHGLYLRVICTIVLTLKRYITAVLSSNSFLSITSGACLGLIKDFEWCSLWQKAGCWFLVEINRH